MKLDELIMSEFLPQFMQQDKTAMGIAYALEKQLKKVILKIADLKIYSNIGSLPENILDELAWQFNIPEYNTGYSLEIKRALVKSCIDTHRHRGTVSAVEKVINNIFGVGFVEEWFEYGGEPGYFKIHTTNSAVTDEMVEEFERVLTSTQNIRSWLEQVIIELVANMNLFVGMYCHESEVARYQ